MPNRSPEPEIQPLIHPSAEKDAYPTSGYVDFRPGGEFQCCGTDILMRGLLEFLEQMGVRVDRELESPCG